MGLVDHDAAPVQLPQLGTVGHDHLEGGDQPLELQHARQGVALKDSEDMKTGDESNTPGSSADALFFINLPLTAAARSTLLINFL